MNDIASVMVYYSEVMIAVGSSMLLEFRLQTHLQEETDVLSREF